MARKRKKGQVRAGHGAMCNICGKNCGKGAALKSHIQSSHDVSYEAYKKCFYPDSIKVIVNAWDDSVSTRQGHTVLVHVLVRRIVGDPGHRGVPRAARPHG